MRQFACDAVIIKNGKVLLIKRRREPFRWEWALPGGRIKIDETAEECVVREVREETGLFVRPIALTGVYSDPKRDPRGIIVAAYLCKIVKGKIKSGDDAEEAAWFSLKKLPKLCSDHGKILKDALKYFSLSGKRQLQIIS
jgi:8-oxo-dGTP diphosphatase